VNVWRRPEMGCDGSRPADCSRRAVHEAGNIYDHIYLCDWQALIRTCRKTPTGLRSSTPRSTTSEDSIRLPGTPYVAAFYLITVHVFVHNFPFVFIVCVFLTLIFKLRTGCCTNCVYLYEPVMLSTVPCLHWRYLSVHCLDTIRLWLLSFQFCFWLYCILYSTVNFYINHHQRRRVVR